MHGTYYNATIAAYVTLYLRLGKDEVGGSNPPSSSKKSCFREKTGLFLYFLTNLICGSRCGTVLTHTLGAVCALADIALTVDAFLSHIESTPFLVATTHTTTPRRKLLLFRALEFNSTLLFTGGSSNT